MENELQFLEEYKFEEEIVEKLVNLG